MSTRAIIGVMNPDDTVIGVWQWNDGEGLLQLLSVNFNTLEEVEPLINLGVVNLICDEEQRRFLENWQIENEKVNQGVWHHFGRVHAYQGNEYRFSKPTLYKSVDDAANQDINCLYLFDAETLSWSCVR